MTVVEVVVALALIGLMASSIAVLTGRTSAAVAEATGRDGARQVAAAMLESAAVYGCGLARGDEDAATAAGIRARCWGGLGDSTWRTAVGTTAYDAALTAGWTQIGVPPDRCADAADRPAPVRAEADGLARSVLVRWRMFGRDQQLAADDYQAVPPDAAAYRDTSRGAIVLNGPAGASASVQEPSGPVVGRAIGSGGCALFSFLPAGTIQWTVGATSGNATITAESITSAP